MKITLNQEINTEFNPGDIIMFIDGNNILFITNVEEHRITLNGNGSFNTRDTLYKVKTLSRRNYKRGFDEREELYYERNLLSSIREGRAILFKDNLEKSILSFAGFDV